MKSYYNYGNTGRKVISIFMAILYLVLVANVSRLGKSPVTPTFYGASLLGVLTAVEILLSLLMVAVDYEVGGALAIGVVSIATFVSIIPILITHSLAPLPGALNSIASLISVCIIRKKLWNERSKAFIDDLTGIGNRKNLTMRMNHLINHRIPFYLVLLDVDHFKKLNDALGHSNGDELLKELADKWSQVYPSNVELCRLGGDEFVLLIKKRTFGDISVPVQKYIDVVGQIAKAPNSLCPTLSISTGIVEFPYDGEEIDDLLKKADLSVRKAQDVGRNVFMKYKAEYEEDVIRDLNIENRIKTALDNDLFYMVYQPQFEITKKKLRGFESLIRMKPNGDDPIFPGDFIPVAEKSHLIVEIGEFVLKRVISDFGEAIKGRPDLIVSVNVSAKQLYEPGFVDFLEGLLEETGFNPGNLEIEITEYCMMNTEDEAVGLVNELKKTGVKIAMDDFGTGFSSLSYLLKLPIDLLKIDKSLVDDIGRGEIIDAICAVAHALDCEVIAEGVEEEMQIDVLLEKHCNFVQGYIWSKPLEYQDAIALLDGN